MKTLLLLLALPLIAFAQNEGGENGETQLADQLRDALYAEEVTRDPTAAAEIYEQILTDFDRQRPLAASALFRLAEVRRKQDRPEDAIALYQRLLREFPNAENEGKLARQHLTSLDAPVPKAQTVEDSELEQQIRKYEQMARNSPDVFHNSVTFSHVVTGGNLTLVKKMLELGIEPQTGLYQAAVMKHLEIMKLLIAESESISGPVFKETLKVAAENAFHDMLKLLLRKEALEKVSAEARKQAIESALSPVILRSDFEEDISNLILSRLQSVSLETFKHLVNTSIQEARLKALEWILTDEVAEKISAKERHQIVQDAFFASLGLNDKDMKQEVLLLLLKQGAEVNTPRPSRSEDAQNISPLMHAISWDNKRAFEFLLEQGADVNLSVPETNRNALLTAVTSTGNHTAFFIRKLLEKGANPNATLKGKQIPPLHYALGGSGGLPFDLSGQPPIIGGSSDKAEQIVARLLKHGADPNHRIENIPDGSEEEVRVFQGKTPLDFAWEIGATGNRADYLKILLEAGAKPSLAQLRDALEVNGTSVLNQDIRQLLVAHSPQLSPDDPQASQLLEKAARQNLDIVPLLKAGATPSDTWKEEFFSGATGDGLKLLNERFLYPELGSPESIVLFKPAVSSNGRGRLTTLVEKELREDLPDFALALLNSDISLATQDNELCPIRIELWRKNNTGQVVERELDLASDNPLPNPQWGDLVTITIEDSTSPESPSSPQDTLPQIRTNGQTDDYDWETLYEIPSIFWHLRKRISFPIKLTIDGKSRDLTLRGDRLVYDPTEAIAPFLNTYDLIELTASVHFSDIEKITIQRGEPGKPTHSENLILDSYSQWQTFIPKPNDHINVETLKRSKGAQKVKRGSRIQLKISDTPITAVTVEANHFKDWNPTLVELLTFAYAPSESWPITEESDLEARRLGYAARRNLIPLLLKNPDFTNIRIRRLDQNDEGELKMVDLEEIIQACDEDTSPEEARRKDIPLREGDIVELSLANKEEPWTGFSNAEIRYFSKVLNCTVQFTDRDHKVSKRKIQWKPARWVPFRDSFIPLAPKSGLMSTTLERANFQTSLRGSFSRGEHSVRVGGLGDIDKDAPLFLREGDRISD